MPRFIDIAVFTLTVYYSLAFCASLAVPRHNSSRRSCIFQRADWRHFHHVRSPPNCSCSKPVDTAAKPGSLWALLRFKLSKFRLLSDQYGTFPFWTQRCSDFIVEKSWKDSDPRFRDNVASSDYHTAPNSKN